MFIRLNHQCFSAEDILVTYFYSTADRPNGNGDWERISCPLLGSWCHFLYWDRFVSERWGWTKLRLQKPNSIAGPWWKGPWNDNLASFLISDSPELLLSATFYRLFFLNHRTISKWFAQILFQIKLNIKLSHYWKFTEDLSNWKTKLFHLPFRTFLPPHDFYIYAFSRRFYPKRLTIHSGYTFFYPYLCSLGIKPTTFCAANTMLYYWATQEHMWSGKWCNNCYI